MHWVSQFATPASVSGRGGKLWEARRSGSGRGSSGAQGSSSGAVRVRTWQHKRHKVLPKLVTLCKMHHF